MLPEFSQNGKSKFSAIVDRMWENKQRKERGMPTVGQEIGAAVKRLQQKFPNDSWIESAKNLAKFDEYLDKKAEYLLRLSRQANNN